MAKGELKFLHSIQMDLFNSFLANDPTDLSNTIEMWESIPKYFFTPAKIKSLRDPQGKADPYEWGYSYNGQAYEVTIHPAHIKEDGGWKSYFPSASEELIEEILKKVFTHDGQGVHIPKEAETWVKFSIRQIWRELKARGRERNAAQIKLSLDIMNQCHITVRKDNKEVYKGPVLGELVKIDRQQYLENTDAQWAARLPGLMSMAINRAGYRQFNYARLMDFNEQLSRWIYKKLVHRYRHASLMHDYHFSYQDVRLNSGLCQSASEQFNRKKVITALEELQANGAIASFKAVEKKEGKKIVDVVYNVTAAMPFITEQKAANKRFGDPKAERLRAIPSARR